ncbi:MAG: acyltransferase [Methylovulum sp.]|nr:acyltransferase [Methylovulum sp.]
MKTAINQWLKNTFELVHSHDNKKNISSMEGIRGIAAFLVFIEHYVAVLEEKIGISQQHFVYELYLWFRNIGSVGVDLFFVLSGYLIYGAIISKHRAFMPYILRRIQRIYPTFIAVFIIYLALSFLIPEKSKIPTETIAALGYLLQSFLLMPPLFSDTEPLITVAWSLSYEMFFYLFMPLLVGLFRLRRWQANQRILFFLIATVLGYMYFFSNQGHPRMLMFISGILLFEVINNKQTQKTTPYLGGVLFVLSLIGIVQLMLFKIPHGSWWRMVIIYLGFFMLCYECFSWRSPSAKLLSLRPLRWLGNMSYSYYLIHGLTVQFVIMLFAKSYFNAQFESTWGFISFGVFVFMATLIPATLLFVCIEKPFSLVTKTHKLIKS